MGIGTPRSHNRIAPMISSAPREFNTGAGIGFQGWTDPEGSRLRLGALLLAYYDPDNRLIPPLLP
jgi:hypothetical protein